MRVMIVDDEKLICEWLEFCISANPACTLVGVAHNGREGLELYCREKPELVLTDIKMPVMDGLELLHAIRQQSSGTKVVLLTAFADFEMARNALREGADEYLLKTEMNSEVLQEMLSRMMLSCGAGDAADQHGPGPCHRGQDPAAAGALAGSGFAGAAPVRPALAGQRIVCPGGLEAEPDERRAAFPKGRACQTCGGL